MTKRFSFKREKTPSWEIELNDEQSTVLHIIIPSKGLYAMVEGLMDRLTAISEADADANASDIVKEIYMIAAEIISRNEEQLTISGAELEEKYGVSLEFLIAFFHGYIDFVEENTSGKN